MNQHLQKNNATSNEIMPLPLQIINFLFSPVTFIVHNLGPSVKEDVLKMRKEICRDCTLTDLKGERLYRIDAKGTLFCGTPLLEKKIRDPKREGCGCFLKMKWKRAWTSCPNGLWKSDASFVPLTAARFTTAEHHCLCMIEHPAR